MMFLRRVLSRREKPAAQQPRGFSTQQTQAEQDATREHMEAELAADRERRGATDVRPGGEHPPVQDSGRAPSG